MNEFARCPPAAGHVTLRRASATMLIAGALIVSMSASAQGWSKEPGLAITATAPITGPVNRDGDCCDWGGPDKK